MVATAAVAAFADCKIGESNSAYKDSNAPDRYNITFDESLLLLYFGAPKKLVQEYKDMP